MVPGRPQTYLEVRPSLHDAPTHNSPPFSAFQSIPAHQIPPHRRITQDEAPSMMPIPAQNTSHQGGYGHGGQPFAQSLSKPASTSSFTSLSGGGGGAYGHGTGWGKARNIICKKRPERPDADRHTYLMFDETPICIGLVPIVCA
jgi:cyclin-dependent kinase 8/11